jgi:2'-5' RNA ligase
MSDLQVEAALVVLVPEVEPIIGPYRNEYDPAAAAGMPAHITINYPFIPGIEPSNDLYRRLAEVTAEIRAFEFSFHQYSRFPDVLYLAPEPEYLFKELIEKIAKKFPESPPYGGVFDTVVPHLTVAHSEDGGVLRSIESQLGEVSPNFLPISTFVDQIVLMDNRTGRWKMQKPFRLGIE